MTKRRWAALAAGVASVVVIAVVAAVVWSSTRYERFEPGAQSYLELACGLHGHQRDMSRAAIEDDEAERELAYAESSLLLEVGNRTLDTKLQDLSEMLDTALSKRDDDAFADTRKRIDDECGGGDEFSPEPEHLVDLTCAIGDGMKPGSGQEVQLTLMSHLAHAAAEKDEKYDTVADKTTVLVFPGGGEDPMAVGPSKSQLADVQKACRAA